MTRIKCRHKIDKFTDVYTFVIIQNDNMANVKNKIKLKKQNKKKTILLKKQVYF